MEMVIAIVTNRQPISYFDEFVAKWKAEGGDAITAEVNKILERAR
jgi:hypothetical protein